jgi:hypothetical protein
MQFKFICNDYGSGYLALTPPRAVATTTSGISSSSTGPAPLLLVTDAGLDAGRCG